VTRKPSQGGTGLLLWDGTAVIVRPVTGACITSFLPGLASCETGQP
jgi:hypothetical protein